MLKRHFSFGILSAILAAGSLAFVGCADNDYDLGDLDGTVAFGSDEGLALPASSTHDIRLNYLLDIDDSDCIDTLANGDYIFTKEGDDVDPTHPEIDPISVTEQSATDIPQKIGPNQKPDGFDLLPSGTVLTGTSGQITASINMFNFSANKPEDVEELTKAFVNADITLTLSFNNDLQQFLNKFNSLSIEFPEYMTLTSPSIGTISGHTISFGQVSTASTLTLTAKITELDFKTIDSNNLLAIENDKIVMKGSVNINVTYPNLVKGSGNITNMYINGHTQISTVTINKAAGRFDPSIDLDDVGDVKITDVPDFLDDPDVKIILNDPQITLNVSSDLDIDGLIDGTLTSYFKNGTTATVTVPNIRIPRSAETKIMICRQPKSTTPAGYNKVYAVDDLKNLIKSIPERIAFKANAHADNTQSGTFELGHQYTITTAYRFDALLALDKGSTIVYNDTINEWAEDLEDITLSEKAKVEVTFDVKNDVPAEIKLTATPIDKNFNDLSHLITVSDATINAKGTTKDVTITIEQKDKNALKSLDGILLKATVTSAEATPLNASTQIIKLDNIRVLLKGKVRFDDND